MADEPNARSPRPTRRDPAATPPEPAKPCPQWERYLHGRHPRQLSPTYYAAFLDHLRRCEQCYRVSWDDFAAREALASLRPSSDGYPLPAGLSALLARTHDTAADQADARAAADAHDGDDEAAAATVLAPGRDHPHALVQASLFSTVPTEVIRGPRDDVSPRIVLVPTEGEQVGADGATAGAELTAVFAFRLTGVRPGGLPTTHSERIAQQALLLTRLEPAVETVPPAERAVELRYVAWPGGLGGDAGEIAECYLLGRLAARDVSPAELLRRAGGFERQVAEVAAHVLPGYAFEPLARDGVLHALHPFDLADAGEIRSRIPGDASGDPLPLLGIPDADAILDQLALQRAPTLLSVAVGPTEPAHEGQADADEAADDDPRPAAVAVSDADTSLAALPNHALRGMRAAALSRRAYRCRVQVASADALSDALVATLAGEFGGTGRLTMQGVWQNPVFPHAAGAAFVRPRAFGAGFGFGGGGARRSEFAMAEHNLRTVGFTRWADAPGGGRKREHSPASWPLSDLGEVSRLFALPVAARWLSDRAAALALPFSAKVSAGSRLGRGLAPHGIPRPVQLPTASRPFHTWIVGQTGTGKSTLLETLILQDILAGRGVIAIDPHGDLIGQVLAKIPAERMGDVVLFDPADVEYPVGINPLEATGEEQQALVVSSFIGLLRKLFDPQHQGIVGPRFEHAVRNGLLTVMSSPEGGTLIEFMRCFTDNAYVRDALLPHVTDPLVRRYWTDQIANTADFHKSEVLDYVVSKFGPFVTDFTVRRIIGQTHSGFSFREAMDSGKIVLMSLAKGKLGATNANFLGLILLPMILQAALSRADLPAAARRETCLYVDEFHNYETDSLALMLAEARKYQLALTLANQHIGQLTGDVRDALVGNVGNIVSFRLGVADAAIMEEILAPSPVTARDLVALPNHVAYGRLLIEGRRTPAFTLHTEPVAIPADAARAERIRDYSRSLYGRERARVDDAIRRRAHL